MNNLELERLLNFISKGKVCFFVMSKDEFMNIVFCNKKSFYAVNTANENDDYGHWLMFYVINHGTHHYVEMMDRFGENPSTYGIDFPLKIDKINLKPLQDEQSDFCGSYVVYYMYYRLCGYSFETILKTFTSNRMENDKKVKKITDSLIRLLPSLRPATSQKLKLNCCKMCALRSHYGF